MPTYGLVSRAGVIPNSYTFDHCGPMAWTVEDCAILLQCLAGHDPRDPASASRAIPDYRSSLKDGLRGVRVGVLRHLWEEGKPDPELVAAMEAAIETGADDVESDEDEHVVFAAFEALNEVAAALEAALGPAKSTGLAWRPKSLTPVEGDAVGTLLKLIDGLEDDDDVQTVWGNYDISDADLEAFGA
jgi:Asp-tRNA(Asn)/Glu-tRNA(Gln) amidotransferase A subunit family amidase